MDVAMQKVQKLSKHIPEQPHQLAFAIDKRYRIHPDKVKALEENIHPGLQYMTFVSDLERGVLMTRSYDDMRDEPPAPNASQRPPTTPAQADKKPATKISLSDYKNKVKKLSQSPPQPAMGSKPDDSLRVSSQEARNQQDQKRKDGSSLSRESKPQGLRDPLFQERPSSLPPKPPAPARDLHDSSDRRKRPAEEEDATRPLKRSRPDINGSSQERVPPKHDGMRNGSTEVSRKKESGIARVKSPRPETKPPSSLEPNGRSILKAAMNPNRGTSPDSRSRAGSLNGVRPTSSGSTKSTPSKTAPPPTSKTSVPPLLSPLHLSFNESDGSAKIKEAKKEDGMESQRGKADRTGSSKKQDSRMDIPPLLSPTLPPILEAELARRKKTSKAVDSKSPVGSKKARPAKDEDEEPLKKKLIVTLKYNKRVAKRVQRLLALPPRKERSTSIDSQPTQPSRKRPLPNSGGTITVDASDSIASKRPRQAEHAASKTVAPSTPLRPSISVSHHVNTPGEVIFEPPSQKVLLANVPPNIEALKQRYQRYIVLGTNLKHTRDDVVKNFPPTNGVRLMPDMELKLSTVTGIEAILSYMVGFNALSEARYLERKPKDHALWKSLLPLVSELQLSVREHIFPKAILSILQERVHQEILACLLAGDFRNQILLQDLHRAGKEHDKVKRLLPVLFRQVEDANEDAVTPLQLPVIYSGEPAEQAASKTLMAIKSWAMRERVDWAATLSTEEVLSGI